MRQLSAITTIWSGFWAHRTEVVFSAIFTLFLTVGYALSSNNIPSSALKALVFICGSLVVWAMVFFGLTVVKHLSLPVRRQAKAVFLKGITDRKLWLLTSLFIFICYLPIILTNHSTLSYDSWSSIRQLTGEEGMQNNHPVIFTLFVGIFVQIGLMFDNLEVGTILYSIAQSAILAMIFACVIVWMRKEGVGRNGIVATFLFYAVLPINAVAGTILWKDILFAGFGLMFLLVLRQIYIERDRFFTPKKIAFFLIFAFLFCAWRNNGFYAYSITAVLALIIGHKVFLNKKYLLIFSLPILLYVIYSSLTLIIAKPANSVEAMSVPLQQIARTVKYHDSSITESDKSAINEVLPYERLGEIYKPGLSDPVKGSFNLTKFNENRTKYIQLWFKLLMEHKKTYIAAFLYNTYGYVYPFHLSPTATDKIFNNEDQVNALDSYTDTAYANHSKAALIKYRDLVMSVIPILYNIGFYTCVILLGLYVAIIRKKKELTGVFILLACLFLTTILGPVNGEFRYLYLFVIATPFILASVYAGYTSPSKR